MSMRKNSIKLNISEQVATDFFYLKDSIKHYLVNKTPYWEQLSLFGITDLDPSFAIFNSDIQGSLQGIEWSSFVKEIPKLNDFFTKYNLANSITFLKSSYAPAHRHDYNDGSSRWSITVLDYDHPGVLRFHEPKPHINESDISNPEFNMELLDCIEEVRTYPKDIYSIDTWSWHSWKSDFDNHTETAVVFYLQETNSYDQAINKIQKLESY